MSPQPSFSPLAKASAAERERRLWGWKMKATQEGFHVSLHFVIFILYKKWKATTYCLLAWCQHSKKIANIRKCLTVEFSQPSAVASFFFLFNVGRRYRGWEVWVSNLKVECSQTFKQQSISKFALKRLNNSKQDNKQTNRYKNKENYQLSHNVLM